MTSTPRRIAGRAYRHFRPRRDPNAGPVTYLPIESEGYRGLDSASLLFDRIRVGRRTRSVNLALPSVATDQLSAGPMTALRGAKLIAEQLALPLRVATFSRWNATQPGAESAVKDRLNMPELEFVHVGQGATLETSPSDVWIVTWWQTAHAADIACRLGVLNPTQVVYFVQDYEPGFHAWSTAAALAQTTYHAGFHLVVNSEPVAVYLRSVEGLRISDDRVFAPDLDYSRLEAVARARTGGSQVRVFFYSRPSIPRNLFALGTAALRRSALLIGRPWSLTTAGEINASIEVPGIDVRNAGRMSHEGYYELLSQIDVGLSLQMSPHPSHPPLDIAVSGARAVTNEFGGLRAELHPNVVVSPADPDRLAERLAEVIEAAPVHAASRFVPLPEGSLGYPMSVVLANLVSSLNDEAPL